MSDGQYSNHFLFDMALDDVDSETMEWLRGQEFYRKLSGEKNNILEKFPCIEKALEGEGEISLTKEEHEAVVRYLDIRRRMEAAERREYYRFGHVHANRYREEVAERKCHAASRKEPDREQCGHQDLPGCPLIRRLLEGDLARREITLSAEEQKALEHFFRYSSALTVTGGWNCI